MSPHSLRLRLVAAGAIAVAIALLLAGFGLAQLFERQLLRTLANELKIDLRQTLSTLELDATGRPVLRREPTDPRFDEPLSGLYWQISADTGSTTRSRSLWDATLPPAHAPAQPGSTIEHRLTGPDNTNLLAVERTVVLTAAGKPTSVRVVVATDLQQVAETRRSFVADLIPALAILGGALAAAMWVQIGLGLKPLTSIRTGIAAVRQGEARRLEGPAPSEVAPLVEEINGLLTAQEKEIEQARGRAADLAHGLKTPLAALAADVRELEQKGEHDIAGHIRDVGETMRRHVERELTRARIRGARGFGSVTPTPLRPLVETMASIQKRTQWGRPLAFEIAIHDGATIAIDKADLAELLGNLMENAARHARSRVRIGMHDDGRISIEDDGAGIPDEMHSLVLERGKRLDERRDSTGLGLAIVQDILEAYGRPLTLDSSSLGGLRVTF
jgi:signal transduction histidine kinase